jgi:hypothetical protein
MHDGPTSEPTSTIGQVVDQLQQRIDALPPDQVLAVGDGRAATRVTDQVMATCSPPHRGAGEQGRTEASLSILRGADGRYASEPRRHHGRILF